MHRRGYLIALLLLAVAGGLLLWVPSLTWGTAQVPLGGLDESVARTLPVSGRELAPLAAVAAVVGWAGIAGLVATRGWGRPVVGVVIAAAGVAAIVSCAHVAFAPAAAIDAIASADAGTALQVASTWTPWWWLAMAGGLLIVIAALLAGLQGRTWPALGARYERTAPPADPWAQLDAGQDPTA